MEGSARGKEIVSFFRAVEDELRHTENFDTFSKLLEPYLNEILEALIQSRGSFSTMRETAFGKMHRILIESDFRMSLSGYLSTLLSLSAKPSKTFVMHFFMKLIECILRSVKLADEDHVVKKLSDEDNQVIFFIAGYLLKRVKNAACRQYRGCENYKHFIPFLEFVQRKNEDNDSSFVAKYQKWLDKIDRGGLLRPCDEFFFMIRQFENICRGLGGAPAKHTVTENVFQCPVVLHYWEKLTGNFGADKKDHLLELLLRTFLNVRGNALANKLKKDYEIRHKKQLRARKALRQSLKENKSVEK